MDASYKIQRGIHVHLIQFFMCPEFWVHISVCLRFFAPLRGLRVLASNSGVATLRNFHRPQARENACWGAPQTRRTSGHFVQKSRRKRLLSAARSYRSWALFSRPSVWPSRWSMFALTATACRISAWALRYSA